MDTRTSFFDNKLSLNIAATLDPYAELVKTNPETGVVTGRRVNQFAWKSGQGIGKFRNVTMNINGNLNPAKQGGQAGEMRDQMTDDFLQQGGQLNEFVENEINQTGKKTNIFSLIKMRIFRIPRLMSTNPSK